MDKSTTVELSRLRQKLVLPMDVSMVPGEDLDEGTKKGIPHSETDIVVTRSRTRSTSKVIDKKLCLLLEEFRNPISITEAVARFTSGDRDEAASVLEEFLPIAIDFIATSILVFEEDAESENSQTTLSAGEIFQRFTVLSCVQNLNGEAVYQVRGDDEEFYALKIIELRKNDKHLVKNTQISNEIAVLSGLASTKCDCAVTIADSGENAGCLWLATNWIQGTPVSRLASELRTIGDIEGLLKLVFDVANSYALLHKSGFLHGDIHPGNVLVTKNGEVKLVDFGIGQSLSNPLLPSNTGIAFYSAPEVANAHLNKQLPPAASELGEQFSVAALIFELLSGEMYTDFNLEQNAMHSQIANANPKELTLANGERWASMNSCLRQALSVDPRQRFPNMSAFAKCIDSQDIHTVGKRSNSYARKRRATHDRLSKFVQSSLDELPVDVEEFFKTLTVGPTCSLSGGAAGVAYALYRIACMRESADLHNRAEQWAWCAERHQQSGIAYHDKKNASEFAVVDPCSIHHGAGGIAFVQCLLSACVSDLYRAERSAERLLLVGDKDTTVWDATLGKLSVVLALCEILSTTPELKAENSVLVEKANAMLHSVWAQLDGTSILSAEENVGFGHGTMGLLYTTLMVSKWSDFDNVDAFYSTLQRFTCQLQPSGRGSGFPWRTESGQVGMMNGWCNGSAGAVFLFSALYEYDSNDLWLDKAIDSAWHVWESDSGIYDLCCGSAGRIFSLLRIYQVTNDTVWVKRAEIIATNAIRRLEVDDTYPHWNLFKGRLGLALAVEALKVPDEASMPMMGIAV